MLSELRYPSMVKYGQEEHGSKNNDTTTQTTNAHAGEETLDIRSCILGLQEKGTSITNHLPYRKKSLRLASQTTIPSIQTMILMANVLVAEARAEKIHIPIARYVTKTARENSAQANKVLLLL